MKPKFSIIIPLYNKAPYIRKALESVAAQTFTDWECIIVNDGSTDNSMERIRGLEDERIRVISQTNMGVAAARNNGVAASAGEYICFLDADDWWEPEFLAEIDKLIAAYPDAGIYATNYIYFKPGKTHVALSLPTGYIHYPQAYLENGSMPVTSITACMPRRVFEQMGGFPKGIKLGEDFLLWAKTALHYPVAFSSQPLAYYNNAVPASQRATRNLYKPAEHMLFHMDELEQAALANPHAETWKALFDHLRVDGLMDYWLSDNYHDAAAAELKKVQHGKEAYDQPIWWLKFLRLSKQLGSLCKQVVVKI